MDEYKKLLNCNRNGFDFFNIDDDVLLEQHQRYYKNSKDNYEKMYRPVSMLEEWNDSRYKHPNLQLPHAKIVDTVKDIKPKSICDIGAGVGMVSKFVHHALPESKLICVEGSLHHIEVMKENFKESSDVIAPKMNVQAEIINALAQDLPLEDNSVELIYTCTLMMHIPFVMVPFCMKEFARVSSKYVLHVENLNDIINAVEYGELELDRNLNSLVIDYEKMYSEVGMEHVKSERWKDLHAPCDYVLHLFKKTDTK